MTETVPVPIWLILVVTVVVAVREYFLMRRDEAIRDLWKLYMDEMRAPSAGLTE